MQHEDAGLHPHRPGEGLIGRAADVVLKERRRLVLVARETPLSAVHLENMLDLTRMGAVIMPPVPAFYNRPRGIDDIVEHIVARVLDQFDLELPTARRWQGLGAAAADRPARRARHAPNGEPSHPARPVERPEHPTAL